MVRQKSIIIDADEIQKQEEDRLGRIYHPNVAKQKSNAIIDADELQKKEEDHLGRIYHPPKVVVRAKN